MKRKDNNTVANGNEYSSEGSENSSYTKQVILETTEQEMVIIEGVGSLQLKTEAQIHPPDTSLSQPYDTFEISPVWRKKKKVRLYQKYALYIKKRDELYQSKIEFWRRQKKYEAERNEREKIKSILEQKVLKLKIKFLEANLKKVQNI